VTTTPSAERPAWSDASAPTRPEDWYVILVTAEHAGWNSLLAGMYACQTPPASSSHTGTWFMHIPVADELKALPWVAGYIAGRTAVRYVNLTPDESPYECGQRWTVEAVPWQSPGAGGHPTSAFP